MSLPRIGLCLVMVTALWLPPVAGEPPDAAIAKKLIELWDKQHAQAVARAEARAVSRTAAEAAAPAEAVQAAPDAAQALLDRIQRKADSSADAASAALLFRDPPAAAWSHAGGASKLRALGQESTLKDESTEFASRIGQEERLDEKCTEKVGEALLELVSKRLLKKATSDRPPTLPLGEEALNEGASALGSCLVGDGARRVLGKVNAKAGKLAEKAAEMVMDQAKDEAPSETVDEDGASADTRGRNQMLLVAHLLSESGG